MNHSPNETDSLAFEWSVDSADGSPPAQLRPLQARSTEVEVPPHPDVEALELLRAAGLHLDQEALQTPTEGARQLVLSGAARANEIAVAIADSVSQRHATLAVDATTEPLRIYEVVNVTTPLLVISSALDATRQIPAEVAAIEGALRRAVNGTPPNDSASASETVVAAVPPDSSTTGSTRSDEMVMQEPLAKETIVDALLDDSEEPASDLTRRIDRVRSSTKRLPITARLLPASIFAALGGARRFGAPRRWLMGAAVAVGISAALETLRNRRRDRERALDADRQAQATVDAERVAMEQSGQADATSD